MNKQFKTITEHNKSFNTNLKELCLKNNGFTFKMNLKPNNSKKGFYISITDNNHKDINKAIYNLIDIRNTTFKHLSNKLLNIGFWKDTETNLNYLDLSIHNKNKENALLIAKLFNQKAIWDIKNFKEIRVLN